MLKHALVAALVWLAPAAHAAPTDDMFARLKAATEEAEAADVAADIWATWLESGSPTVDLLMERVGIALESGDTETAHELLDRVILLKRTIRKPTIAAPACFSTPKTIPKPSAISTRH
jgi:hypothetical protein